MIRRLCGAFAGVAVIALVASGCSGYESARFGGGGDVEGPSYEQYQDDSYSYDDEEPSQAEIDQMMQESDERVRKELGLDGWSCTYTPTMNDDWHDDVLCRNGSQLDRPYLREWDSFVTQDEIIESAREYEAQLNAGR